MVTCYECGTQLKSQLALNAHVGSHPCKLAKTFADMRRQDWAACTVSDARDVLAAAEIEYEVAPVARRGPSGVSTPARVSHPELRVGVWCPSWAAPVVEVALPREVRIEILKWAQKDVVRHVDALKTALALGGLEALAALGGDTWTDSTKL